MGWFLLIGIFCVLAVIGFFITGRPFKFAVGGIVFLIALAFVSLAVIVIWTMNDQCSAPFTDHNSTYCQNRAVSTAKTQGGQNIKCPEQYATEQERNDAYTQYSESMVAAHPNWTASDFAQARADFLVQNNCTQTLQYINENGGMEAYKDSVVKSITTDDSSDPFPMNDNKCDASGCPQYEWYDRHNVPMSNRCYPSMTTPCTDAEWKQALGN